jgi:GDP-4-dehydro-6-deoxy-D-mannose reductase
LRSRFSLEEFRMKKVLITGITGFVGSHLADHLLALGDYEICGLHRWRSRMDNVRQLLGRIQLLEGDITDARSLAQLVRGVRPDLIFHLAAQSFVPASWREPDATLTNNVRGQINLFEAVLANDRPCRIQIAGSSEEYGLVHPDEVPITEDNPLRPLSPYAVSKVTQDLLAYQYGRSYDLDIVRTRGFNHTGPRRGEVFVCSNFAKQIAEVEAGRREPIIQVGNLEATRDFSDVRDIVRGYRMALERGRRGEVYNLCSGQDRRIGDILDELLSMTDLQIEIRQDPERLRPSDVPILRGSAAKFHAETGWQPEIPFRQTLTDLLHFWREQIASEGRQG